MKILKFKFREFPNKVFKLPFPEISLKREKFFKTILDLFYILSLASVFLLPALLVLTNIFNTTFEREPQYLINYLIVSTAVLTSLFLGKLILAGKKVVIDPNGFIPVLLFALGLIFTAVTSINVGSSSTFGNSSTKMFSGLFVMILVSIFYFISLYIGNNTLLKRFTRLFSALFLFWYVLILVIGILDSSNITTFLFDLFFVLVISLTVILAIKNTRLSYWYKVLFAIILFSVLFYYLGSTLDFLGYLVAIFIIFNIGLFLIWLSFLQPGILRFKRNFKEFVSISKELFITRKPSKLLRIKSLYTISHLLLFLSPFILSIVLIVVIATNNINIRLFTETLESFKSSILSIGNNTATLENFRTILTGKGVAAFSFALPFFSNVIQIFGLLGIVAYGLIVTFGVKLALSTLKKYGLFSTTKFFVSSLFIFLTLYFVFVTPSLFQFLIWWILFTILCIYQNSKNRDLKLDAVDFYLKLRGKTYKGEYLILRTVLILLLFIGTALLTTSFLKIVAS